MQWAVIAQLVAEYGIPFVEFLISKINTSGTVTPDEWAQLKLLTGVTARQELLDRLAAAGIAPTDPKAVALLALVP